jgi:hypothetical protein
MSTTHMTAERLAAFLDHQLSPAAEEEVVAHFAECAACRQEMTAMRQLLKGREKRIPWYIVTPMLVALAASIAFLMVPRVGRVDSESPSSIRSGAITSTDQVQPITMVSPTDDAMLDARHAMFAWRSIGAHATYLLTVQDSTGSALWSSTTEDTIVTLPDSVRLTAGAYYWSVAARLADARSAKTGVRRFLAR